MVQFYHLLAHEQLLKEKEKDREREIRIMEFKKQIDNSLKNLLFFTHQNLLIMIQITLTRIMSRTMKTSNQYAQSLSRVIDAKIIKKIKTKGEAVQLLKVHMQNSENIFRNLVKQNSKKRFFLMIGEWLNTITLVPNEKLREMLYNIEAFRADAVNINPAAQDSNKPQGKGPLASKALSSSTKTSGNSNLVGGASSLTGKNPFAILKASAIASSQQA